MSLYACKHLQTPANAELEDARRSFADRARVGGRRRRMWCIIGRKCKWRRSCRSCRSCRSDTLITSVLGLRPHFLLFFFHFFHMLSHICIALTVKALMQGVSFHHLILEKKSSGGLLCEKPYSRSQLGIETSSYTATDKCKFNKEEGNYTGIVK